MTRSLTIARGLLGAMAFVVHAAAFAATFTHEPFQGNGSNKGVEIIVIEGDIVSGDEEKFRALSLRYDKAFVGLVSPGGKLGPAIEIGKMIHLKEYSTVVPSDATCTSACALIWAAGAERYLSPKGHLGFHASYQESNGRKEETGLGNALVGHYLGLLNLSEKAIVFATSAGPNQIQWLNARNKEEAGIAFKDFDDSPKPTIAVDEVISTADFSDDDFIPQGWRQVASTDKQKHYMASSQIYMVGKFKAAWTLIDARQDPDVKYYKSKDLWYFDCGSRRSALKGWVDYDKDDKIIDREELPDRSLEWKTVIPESVGESKLDAVCKR